MAELTKARRKQDVTREKLVPGNVNTCDTFISTKCYMALLTGKKHINSLY